MDHTVKSHVATRLQESRKAAVARLVVVALLMSLVVLAPAAAARQEGSPSCANWGKSWWAGSYVGLNFKGAKGWCTDIDRDHIARVKNDRRFAPDPRSHWFTTEWSVYESWNGYLTWGNRTFDHERP